MAAAAVGSEPFVLQRDGAWCIGPWRRPVNNSHDEAGTIHDDATAQRLEPVRVLAAVRPGWREHGLPTRVAAADVQARRPLLTEPVADDEVPLSTAIHALRVYEPRLPIAPGAGIGMFGAIEWQWLHGPMQTARDYEVAAQVLAVGTSPKSEMLWTEATMSDPAEGREVARMLMLSRLLKQSSRLWNPGETNR